MTHDVHVEMYIYYTKLRYFIHSLNNIQFDHRGVIIQGFKSSM